MANLIAEVIRLNAKQKRTVSMIFHHVMRHQGRPAVENNDQLLLYVGGEGGTGKSWVIEAVSLGMKILDREQEVLVTVPTGRQHHTTHRVGRSRMETTQTGSVTAS